MTRLLLVRHAPTPATVRGAFPADEPLGAAGLAAAAAAPRPWPAGAVALCSPAMRCLQTAVALGLAPRIEPALAECDFGSWAGATFSEVSERDPTGVATWLADRAAAPHGGESLQALLDRVGRWLGTLGSAAEATTVAVTHEGVIRAALVTAGDLDPAAFWTLRVAPLSVTAL